MSSATTNDPAMTAPPGIIKSTLSFDFPGFSPITRGAYHEAGHTVAAFLSGLTVKRVWITVDEARGVVSDGRTEIWVPADFGGPGPAHERERRRLSAELEFICGGCGAETLRFPELDRFGRMPYLIGESESGDFQVALRLAHRLARLPAGSARPGGGDIRTIIFDALVAAKARLARPENWRAVVRLADLLVRHRRIDGPTAERIWRQAGPVRPRAK